MQKTLKSSLLVLTLVGGVADDAALASPSTQIWIPSTDIQPFKTGHLNIDNYFRASGKAKSPPGPGATRDANVMDIGPTAGVLPFQKVQMEVGFDYYVIANDPNDNHPWSGNFKIGTPEDSIFKGSPAIAAGMYNMAPSQSQTTGPLVTAGQNIAYGLVAKTLPAFGSVPSLGRLSVGGYRGSERALVNQNSGVLASWDRTMTEISDKLWVAVDYQSGTSAAGALNVGFSWAFAKNVTLIFGYDVYNRQSVAGNNTFTTQLDINFP